MKNEIFLAIDARIKEKKIRKQDIANKMGLSKQTLYERLKNKAEKTSIESLLEIAQAIGIKVKAQFCFE